MLADNGGEITRRQGGQALDAAQVPRGGGGQREVDAIATQEFGSLFGFQVIEFHL